MLDFCFVKKIHKKILENNSTVPKNLTWVMLIPGNYSLTNEIDCSFTQKITLQDLYNCGLVMSAYYHPNDKSIIILLLSLQKVFMLAKCIEKNIYEILMNKETHYKFQIKEIDNENFDKFIIL